MKKLAIALFSAILALVVLFPTLGSAQTTTPTVSTTWTNYCTGLDLVQPPLVSHPWQIWRYDNSNPPVYEFVENGTTANGCVAPPPPPPPPSLPPLPPPLPAFNLVGCWSVQYDGNGFIVDDNGSMSPFSPTSQTVCLDPGQVNEDGTHSYQGRVLGYEGSSAYAYYQPNVLPGMQKYLSMWTYIPEPGFGVSEPGYHSVTISAFVDQSESYFWGGANAFYVPERRTSGDLTPNVYRTPRTFYGASVRGWRNGGGKG